MIFPTYPNIYSHSHLTSPFLVFFLDFLDYISIYDHRLNTTLSVKMEQITNRQKKNIVPQKYRQRLKLIIKSNLKMSVLLTQIVFFVLYVLITTDQGKHKDLSFRDCFISLSIMVSICIPFVTKEFIEVTLTIHFDKHLSNIMAKRKKQRRKDLFIFYFDHSDLKNKGVRG